MISAVDSNMDGSVFAKPEFIEFTVLSTGTDKNNKVHPEQPLPMNLS